MNPYEDIDKLLCDGCFEDCETSTSCPFSDPRTPDEIVVGGKGDALLQDIIRERK